MECPPREYESRDDIFRQTVMASDTDQYRGNSQTFMRGFAGARCRLGIYDADVGPVPLVGDLWSSSELKLMVEAEQGRTVM